MTDNDIAREIGDLCIKNKDAASDLNLLLNKDKCTEGMKEYIKIFENGELESLSMEIGDGGQYINVLRKKFDADAANWVWNIETAKQKIKEVILEYKIIYESNKIIPKNTNFEGTIAEWYEKCKHIKISYPAAKNYLGKVSIFLESLYNMRKSGMTSESQKQKFYDLLVNYSSDFKYFYANQIDIFKSVCEFYLETFSDEEIKEIFKNIPYDLLTRDKSDYLNIIGNKVEEYKCNSKYVKLKKMWKEKTNTNNPREWSYKYKMPIFCMLNDEDISVAKIAFDAVNQSHPDEASVDKAISYFKDATFFSKLDDELARNRAFTVSIIKDYDAMLTDVDEIKEYLSERIAADPYDWLGLPEVNKKLKLLAEAKYNETGCEKALEKIDNMELEDVKYYLKSLIKNNMVVGIEIIKNN